jgi:hypothetical protein
MDDWWHDVRQKCQCSLPIDEPACLSADHSNCNTIKARRLETVDGARTISLNAYCIVYYNRYQQRVPRSKHVLS